MNAPTIQRRVSLMPTRDGAVDALFLFALCAVSLIGFRTTYSSYQYLVAGLSGVLLGIVIAHIANVLRQPMISVGAMAVAVFFLLGGALAIRSHIASSTLPTRGTLKALASVSVHGWKQVLTTLPPVASSGPLLAIPYILGILGGVGGFSMARRLRQAAAPALAPALMLVTVIVLGTTTPAARLVQGTGFAMLAFAWIALRAGRGRQPVRNGSRWQSRLTMAAILLIVTGLGASFLGPHLPGGATERQVLRTHITPPFDIEAYPSPLVGFRKYTKDAKQDYSQPLFTVSGSGLSGDSFIRIATLDCYDGSVWGATNGTVATGADQPLDTFQRVGSAIANKSTGQPVSLTVTIDPAYAAANDVNAWLPSVGSLTSIKFRGPNSAQLANTFRYNLATGQGIAPARFVTGDQISFTSIIANQSLSPAAQPFGTPTLSNTGDGVTAAQASQWSAGATSIVSAVLLVAQHLREVGAYTDGGPNQNLSKPGHSSARLAAFLSGDQPTGDDEQYAAAFALMSNALGLPARVVLGAVPEANGVVTGQDVHASVEVHTADGQWSMISYKQFMPPVTKAPNNTPPPQTNQAATKIVPPPDAARPPTDLSDVGQTQPGAPQAATLGRHHSAFRLPSYVVTGATWGGPPVLLILLLCLAIVLYKVVRRSRRRRRGRPSTRVARGWREVLDYARDLGLGLPSTTQTRREQASALDAPDASDLEGLAKAADATIFGPATTTEEAAQAYWVQVEQAREGMRKSVSRLRRLRAALSLRSLRGPREPRDLCSGAVS